MSGWWVPELSELWASDSASAEDMNRCLECVKHIILCLKWSVHYKIYSIYFKKSTNSFQNSEQFQSWNNSIFWKYIKLCRINIKFLKITVMISDDSMWSSESLFSPAVTWEQSYEHADNQSLNETHSVHNRDQRNRCDIHRHYSHMFRSHSHSHR